MFLIFSLLLSSTIDQCLAEGLFRSTANAIQIDVSSEGLCNCANQKDGQPNSHDHHENQDSCQHCHNCHAWCVSINAAETLAEVPTDAFSRYIYFIPSPFYQSLKRPPKV